ncbi:MAG: hypothetical protein AAF456_23665 [Planctomycetota bacterium]
MNSKQILDREFLEIRSKILEIAASLDRIDRAEGTVSDDSKLQLLQKGIAILHGDEADRAEKVQMLFSINYLEQWQKQYEISEGR